VIGHWNAMTRFLIDARIAPDDKVVGATLRRVALGRKNFLHVAKETCGENIAERHSLGATREANDIDPLQYLGDVLVRAGDHPAARIHELLPDRRKRRAAA
jgi:transposase